MSGGDETGPESSIADAVRMIDDLERLRGKLRIAVRLTGDGLGIRIPPARRIGPVLIVGLWLCGWAVGEFVVLWEIAQGGIAVPDLYLLFWLVPWTLAGLGSLWVIGWQLFGVERLFFTAGSLVREWTLLGFGGRRVLRGAEIISVTADGKMTDDLAGFGAVKVETTGRSLRIGSGLPSYEAELVAILIRNASGMRQGGTAGAAD